LLTSKVGAPALALPSLDGRPPEVASHKRKLLLQIDLLFGAMKAYYSMDREHGDLRILIDLEFQSHATLPERFHALVIS
jgi:hypothetical protein